MHKFKIDLPIYSCVVHVIIDNEIEKVVSSMVRKKSLPEAALVNDGSKYYGLAIKGAKFKDYYIFYNTDDVNINIISHEISHIVDFILSEREIENNGEARAYITGYITEKVVDFAIKKDLFINKWIKKDKKEVILNQSIKEDEK